MNTSSNKTVTCFRVRKDFQSTKLTDKSIESKTYFNFDKNLGNPNTNKYYYFNFNHQTELWEQPSCQLANMTSEIKKAFIKCKNTLLMYDVFIEQKQLSLCLKLENKLKSIIDEKQKIKNEYEQSANRLKERFNKQTQKVC